MVWGECGAGQMSGGGRRCYSGLGSMFGSSRVFIVPFLYI